MLLLGSFLLPQQQLIILLLSMHLTTAQLDATTKLNIHSIRSNNHFATSMPSTAERRNQGFKYFNVLLCTTNDAVAEGFDLPQIVQYLSKSFD